MIRVLLSMIRLADVYLMYAESVAQSYGYKASSQAFNLSAVDARYYALEVQIPEHHSRRFPD